MNKCGHQNQNQKLFAFGEPIAVKGGLCPMSTDVIPFAFEEQGF